MAKRDLAAARRFLERGIKRVMRPMLGFKSFWSARIVIAGIQTMHMIRKGQVAIRFDREVLNAFRAAGPGWQTRMNEALKDWLRTHPSV